LFNFCRSTLRGTNASVHAGRDGSLSIASNSAFAPSVASAQFNASVAPALTETSHSAGVNNSLIGMVLLPAPAMRGEYLA
jgi:hypothetical protein